MQNNQSAVIFGALFVAYIVFITVRGELPIYAGFLLSTPTPAGGATTPANTQTGSNTSAANSAVASVTQDIITGAIAAL